MQGQHCLCSALSLLFRNLTSKLHHDCRAPFGIPLQKHHKYKQAVIGSQRWCNLHACVCQGVLSGVLCIYPVSSCVGCQVLFGMICVRECVNSGINQASLLGIIGLNLLCTYSMQHRAASLHIKDTAIAGNVRCFHLL